MTESATQLTERLRAVLAVHFHPEHGAPYWLERARQLGFDPRDRVRSLEDLPLLGPMEPAALYGRRLADLLPRALGKEKAGLIVAQTGGTLARPVWTAYTETEFHAAFVEPFVVAARHVGFPSGGNWLYVGPTGPHIIGRAADAIAAATGSAIPFRVDFDSRWARKLPAGTFAGRRYLGHVVEQATAVIDTQAITTLFTTPVVLAALGEAMSTGQRETVRGIHYGGMAITPDELQRFQTEVFPNAVHLSGYGNTLFGCCLELSTARGRSLQYFPYGNRFFFGVAGGDESTASFTPQYARPGATGRVVFTRLDRTMLLANVVERDQARLVCPPDDAPAGFDQCGVDSPTPATDAGLTPAISLY